MKFLSKSLVAAAFLFVVNAANAVVVDFDDLRNRTFVYDGYQGLDWGNMYVLDTSSYQDSGYVNGTVSGNNVVLNAWAGVASVEEGSTFDFNGAFLTGAWRDGLNIEVTGSLDGDTIYSETVVVDSDAATWFSFDFFGIDSLVFSSFGGVENPNYRGSGAHFAMDNFTFNESVSAVPLPAGLWLFGTALLALGGIRRRQKAQA